MNAKWRRKKVEPLIRISDPEMDMDRALDSQVRLKMSQLLASALKWAAPRYSPKSTETPRRSLDREFEWFSPTRE